MYTKETIQQNLQSNPMWIERALVVLFNRQTNDEQKTQDTREWNGMGFNKPDSRYLSYCSKWVIGGRHLNEKHLLKCGSKLPKYWKQILEEIKMRGGK